LDVSLEAPGSERSFQGKAGASQLGCWKALDELAGGRGGGNDRVRLALDLVDILVGNARMEQRKEPARERLKFSCKRPTERSEGR
jgi:hypothetical protein